MMKKIFFCAFLIFWQNFLSFGQIIVTFKIMKIPPSKDLSVRLFLAGDFNGWNPSDGTWEMTKNDDGTCQVSRNMAGGTYSFKATRGSWQMVECSADGKSIENRTVKIIHDTTIVITIANWQDNFKQEEKKHTASVNVHVISESFDMPQLGRQRRVWIYLPADYPSSHKK